MNTLVSDSSNSLDLSLFVSILIAACWLFGLLSSIIFSLISNVFVIPNSRELYFRGIYCSWFILVLELCGIDLMSIAKYTSSLFYCTLRFLTLFPCIFSGEVSVMSLVQKLWCLMLWKRLRKNWRNLSWGMIRKECLFLWLSSTKSIKSKILISHIFRLFWLHSKKLSGLLTDGYVCMDNIYI